MQLETIVVHFSSYFAVSSLQCALVFHFQRRDEAKKFIWELRHWPVYHFIHLRVPRLRYTELDCQRLSDNWRQIRSSWPLDTLFPIIS